STSLRAPEFALGDGAEAYQAGVERARDEEWATRLFDRDVTLWSADPEVGRAVADRLGWLDAPGEFTDRIAALEGFGDGAVAAGFTTTVVAGMGGSSLAPDVLHRTFGTQEGYLDLRILDSTDPAAVAAVFDGLDPLKTLVIIASKSGTTTEPNAFLAYFWDLAHQALDKVGHHAYETPGAVIAAITDPGKSLDAIEHHDEFREVFLNPPDIGGRYSALTYVGLVPASLIGLDLDALLASATAMVGACREPDPAVNPGVSLGIAMGTLAKAGRDKLTFLPDDEISTFGAWAEQLIAESTGKHGIGIVPVDNEPLGAAGVYGRDRVFVRLSVADGTDGGRDALARELQAAGHPVIRIPLADPIDLGGEFVRWEIATAIAGAVLEIDPFDQPNVEEAKNLTRDVLAKAGRGEALDTGAAPLTPDDPGLADALSKHLARRAPNAYLALQAFIAPTPSRDAAMARIRTLLRDATRNATTAGYGPRFLHSTGQLHKGGAPIGWFLQFTADHPDDREIPGWPYTFGRLIDAQAAGDFAALDGHDVPILRIHLGADPDAGLAALERALDAALRTTREG
ncbi:MAG TPA: transaldolase, partial [Methylomirabilota bacterium]|nr:transaldolase [Methylomirabilota bacterium]